MKDIVVLYDGGCSDGFGGAWAAWKKFKNKANYIGVRHENPPPAGLKNKEVYLIDFTYSKTIIEKLIKENKQVTAIDHHITAKEAVKLTHKYSFAIDRSGAVLAWKYFYPQKPVPAMLKYIEDTDLYTFRLARTKELFAYLNIFDLNFKIWNKLARDLENPVTRKKCVEKGKLILKYENKLVGFLVGTLADLVEFNGYKTLAVNSPHWPSQIGHALVKKLPPIGIIWYQRDNKIIVSLRSDGSVDVGAIAKGFGGGGHRTAAGFRAWANKPLPWRLIQKTKTK